MKLKYSRHSWTALNYYHYYLIHVSISCKVTTCKNSVQLGEMLLRVKHNLRQKYAYSCANTSKMQCCARVQTR